MYNIGFALALISFLVILLTAGVITGRRFGRWLMKHDAKDDVEVVSVAEGALFALLGLLVAFTFTGAYERFEARAKSIQVEANAIETAYLRLGLLAPADQTILHHSFKTYLDSRLATYHDAPSLKKVYAAWRYSEAIQLQIWNQALVACQTLNSSSTTELVLPAINSMFEIADTRIEMVKDHPPAAVFILLIGLAVISAFLAGYTTAKNQISNSIHILSYVAITAITLYIIIDMEFPRLGLITVNSYDQILVDLNEKLAMEKNALK